MARTFDLGDAAGLFEGYRLSARYAREGGLDGVEAVPELANGSKSGTVLRMCDPGGVRGA